MKVRFIRWFCHVLIKKFARCDACLQSVLPAGTEASTLLSNIQMGSCHALHPQLVQSLLKALQPTPCTSGESSGCATGGLSNSTSPQQQLSLEQLLALVPLLDSAMGKLLVRAQPQSPSATPAPPEATSSGNGCVGTLSGSATPEACPAQQPYEPHTAAQNSGHAGHNMHVAIAATAKLAAPPLTPPKMPALYPHTTVPPAPGMHAMHAQPMAPHNSACHSQARESPAAPDHNATTATTTGSPLKLQPHSFKNDTTQHTAPRPQAQNTHISLPSGATVAIPSQRKRFCPSSECYVPHRRIRRLCFPDQNVPGKNAANTKRSQKKTQPPPAASTPIPTAHASSGANASPVKRQRSGSGNGSTTATRALQPGSTPQHIACAARAEKQQCARSYSAAAADALTKTTVPHAFAQPRPPAQRTYTDTPPSSVNTWVSDYAEYGTAHMHVTHTHASLACTRRTPLTATGPAEDSEVSGASFATQATGHTMHAANTAFGCTPVPSNAPVANLMYHHHHQILSQMPPPSPTVVQPCVFSPQMHAQYGPSMYGPTVHAMHVSTDRVQPAQSGTVNANVHAYLSPLQAKVIAAARAACIPEDLINWAAAAAGAAAVGQRDPPYPDSANVPANLRQWHDSLTQPLSNEDTLALLQNQAMCRK